MPKQFYFWTALSWTGIIVFFCLVKSSAIPVVSISNLDKIVHAFFHFVLTSLWFLFFKNHLNNSNVFKPLAVSFLISVFFGVGIEIAQELFTKTRTGDLLDVLANSSGATLAVCVLLFFYKCTNLNKV